jgi:hypothetical protein
MPQMGDGCLSRSHFASALGFANGEQGIKSGGIFDGILNTQDYRTQHLRCFYATVQGQSYHQTQILAVHAKQNPHCASIAGFLFSAHVAQARRTPDAMSSTATILAA